MKKLAGAMLVYAVLLHAADFWTNIFTEWTDKDVHKMMESSPWAKKLDIATGEGGAGVGAGDRFRAGGIGGTRTPGSNSSSVGSDSGQDTIPLYIRWQSALPVKQAAMRMKYDAEVGTSPEAQAILGSTEPNYLIAVEGLTRKITGGGDGDALKKELIDQTALVIKGRNPIAPVDCSISGQEKITAVFVFPKTAPIVLEDKEVEFQSKIGTHTVKQKFHLKEMMYFDRLAL
jgi:hypothetical protein